MAETPNKPTKPRGESLKWTAAQIDELSKVGPGDITAARAYFRRLAPKPFKSLLDAKKRERK